MSRLASPLAPARPDSSDGSVKASRRGRSGEVQFDRDSHSTESEWKPLTNRHLHPRQTPLPSRSRSLRNINMSFIGVSSITQ